MRQFSGTVLDQHGQAMADVPVYWSSSDEDIVSINSEGLATAEDGGSATISARFQGAEGDATVTVLIPVAIKTTALGDGVVGDLYSLSIEASGGNEPYQWTVNAGSLPTGLSMDVAAGVISGTPVEAAASEFEVLLSSGTQSASAQLSLKINEPHTLGEGFGPEQFFLVPAGSFLMGSTDGELDEQPVHTVNITEPFLMQKTELTKVQWLAVMDEVPEFHNEACGDLCPLGGASWNDVWTFLKKLNELHPGMDYRLPTEAEWEYAARAGSTGDFGSGDIPWFTAWYRGNVPDNTGTPQQVATLTPNTWGIFDMHGNVGEWVNDWYSEGYYGESPADDPQGPSVDLEKVFRGGSVIDLLERCRSASRNDAHQSSRSGLRGFRLVRTAPVPPGE